LVSAEAHAFTNPKTGEVISLGARKGDAEVLFTKDREWRSVFRWQRDSAAFAAPDNPGDVSDPVWTAAVALATRLTAVICGDSGEFTTFRLERLPMPNEITAPNAEWALSFQCESRGLRVGEFSVNSARWVLTSFPKMRSLIL
jgi:hypothetical protein